MYTKDETLTLANLGDGAALEKFNAELEKVFADIMDPNTEATEPRSITMKIIFKPDEERETRAHCPAGEIAIGRIQGVYDKVMFGKDVRGRVEAREMVSGQMDMFANQKGKVTPIGAGKGE